MNKDYRTISQILEDDLKPVNEVRYTNIYNRIKGVKGLKRKDLDMISAIDPDILKNVVNSLDFLRDDVQEESISEASALDGINDIVKTKGAKKVNGVMVDMFTASMIQQVYNKVNDANKKKMEKANVQTLVQIAQKVMGMK